MAESNCTDVQGTVVSSQLLQSLDCEKAVSPEYDLGMSKFTDLPSSNENAEPKRLSLSLKKKRKSTRGPTTEGAKRRKPLQPCQRFGFKEVDEDHYSAMSTPFFPKNTKNNNDWAMTNFLSWCAQRNKRNPERICPEDLLDKPPWNIDELCYWLPQFACETRSKTGSKYPASTVFALLAGLLRHMRAIDPSCPNFLDVKDARFKEMHSVIDAYFRELQETGVGADHKHTAVISKEEENLLWDEGVLGVDNPESLLRAVFYYNRKNFCLRGGKEHRGLKLSQLERASDPDRYIYLENGSKNRSGGLWQLHVENKVIPIMAMPEAGDRCHVRLLDKYISKLPQKAHDLDCFYMKPLGNKLICDPEKAWFASQPCRENKLSAMVKDMFSQVGILGKTNHSLRATGASEMFRCGVPEKAVQECTGYRTVKALRMYERTSTSQHKAVSSILVSPQDVQYKEASQPSTSGSCGSGSLTSLFGSASHCVINVNFGSRIAGIKESNITESVERACFELETDI